MSDPSHLILQAPLVIDLQVIVHVLQAIDPVLHQLALILLEHAQLLVEVAAHVGQFLLVHLLFGIGVALDRLLELAPQRAYLV